MFGTAETRKDCEATGTLVLLVGIFICTATLDGLVWQGVIMWKVYIPYSLATHYIASKDLRPCVSVHKYQYTRIFMIVYNSEDLETVQLPINGRMNK